MSPVWFAKGYILGFSIAAPVGPIGVLCIKTSLTQGRGRGLAVGLGAATADAFYGSIAAFGLTAISKFLVGVRLWLQLGGGVFLVYLGIKAWRSAGGARAYSGTADVVRLSADPTASGSGVPPLQPRGKAAGRRFHWPAIALYVSSVGLTLTNPLTILSFVAIFAAMNLAGAPGQLAATLLVAGVFTGSATWWVILSASAGWVGNALGRPASPYIARASAAVLLAFGAAALVAAAWRK